MPPSLPSNIRVQFQARSADLGFEVTERGCGDLHTLADLCPHGIHDAHDSEIVQVTVSQPQLAAWHEYLAAKYPARIRHQPSEVLWHIGDISRLLVHRCVPARHRHLFLRPGNEFDHFLNPDQCSAGVTPMVVYRPTNQANSEYGALKWLGVTPKVGIEIGAGAPVEKVLLAVRSPYLSVPVTGLRDLHALKIPATVAGITACGIVDGMPLAIATLDDSAAMVIDAANDELAAWLESWRFYAPRVSRQADSAAVA